ncbi:hypothetical protein GJ744_001195 [Endocarpon pusillum]|uniref:Uncharacterized protein n=1 Tax=Endocarpon pusillum TaxID=364733 RepID=A0A8H7ACV1_9EURO|nr:hypothetical protein GJ744_001195 [Endocarpon pusillum]
MANPWVEPSTRQQGCEFTERIHSDTYDAINPLKNSNHVGHRVFIVGASKGIGKRTAIAFAESGASSIGLGARSALDDLAAEVVSAAKKGGHKPPQVLTVKLDVLDRSSIDRAAKQAEQEFGGLDILVNNAGWLEKTALIVDSDPEEWWYTMEVNIRGVYLSTRAFLPLLLKGGMKTILNLSSLAAHSARPGFSSYVTTKFAVLKFTEFCMSEYGDQGILAYAFHPGSVMTELAARVPEEAHHLFTDTPELAGHTIVWLTQERREWLAGRYLSCTWDMPELMSRKDEIVQGDKLKFRMVL